MDPADDLNLDELKKEASVDNSKLEEIMRKEITPESQREFFDIFKKSQLFMPVEYSLNVFEGLEDLKPGDVFEPEGRIGFNIVYLTDSAGNRAVPLFTSSEMMEKAGLKSSVYALYMSDLADMLKQTDKYQVIAVNPFTEFDVNMPIQAFLNLFEEPGEESEFAQKLLEIIKNHSIELEENTTLFIRSDENFMVENAVDGVFVPQVPFYVSSNPKHGEDLKYTNILLMPKGKRILPIGPDSDLDIIIAPKTEFRLEDTLDETQNLWMCAAQPFFDKKTSNLGDDIKGGICGFVVGDALGVPVEFYSRSELEKNPVTDMREFGSWNQPKGTWSDDSAMTLATMAAISGCSGKIDCDIIMGEFVKWYKNGKYSQDEGEPPFDMGNTTEASIQRYIDGASVFECGGRGERDNGNGSLMRILPLAYVPDITYDEIENVSGLTHAHPRSKIACVLYVEIAKSMLENDLEISEHIANSCRKVQKHYETSDELEHFKAIFDCEYDVYDARIYVVKTLEAVLYCLLETESYRDAVLKAVNLGHDTDTVAAITGGLAGIYYGYDEIPMEWISDIYKREIVFDLCDDFEKCLR